ncbi:MAG: DUF4974 domain-containing protein [Mollicutes bacterium]|nr:DUF4974 domain-containing protein [Mollicutes bacterium]
MWRLAPQEHLDRYWNEKLLQHPDLRQEVDLADAYLKGTLFPKRCVKTDNKEWLLQEISCAIEQGMPRGRPKKNVVVRHRMIYGAVACVLVLTGLFLYRSFAPSEPDEQIVVNRLEAKEICLISSGKTVSYEDNIDIQIDNKGTVTIQSDNTLEKIEELEIAENTLNTLVVPYGRRSRIELPDGTKAWLNSGSILQFPSTFTGDKREVVLTGEMYIEVKKRDMPFVVKTTDFSVEVLGTAFNVSAYEKQQQSVVLVEGSVGVRSDHVEETCTLSSNEIAFVDRGGAPFRKEQTDVLQYISWVKGYVVLNKTPLISVMKYLERYYNVAFEYIETPRIQSMTCDGKLYLSDNFDNVMRAIGILTDTEYSKENNSIYIYNRQNMWLPLGK